jgi:carbon monoxide dehydrogenase subunit G
MNLNGTLGLAVRPDFAAAGFHDADTLATFLPGGSELTRTGDGAFSFVIIKETKLITLRLPGTLTVIPEQAGYRFTAKARHMMGGSAALSLFLTFAPKQDGCTLGYDGTLETTGLVDRLMRDREDQAKHMVRDRFAAVKHRLEVLSRTRTA